MPDTDNITSVDGCQGEDKQSACSGQPSVVKQGEVQFYHSDLLFFEIAASSFN